MKPVLVLEQFLVPQASAFLHCDRCSRFPIDIQFLLRWSTLANILLLV